MQLKRHVRLAGYLREWVMLGYAKSCKLCNERPNDFSFITTSYGLVI